MSTEITEIFACIASNKDDGDESGDEGIMGAITPLGMTPMVTGNTDVIAQFIQIADASGADYKIKRFVLQEDKVLN